MVPTVPCKCKLTVPRNSIFATRSSILETRKLRVSRFESSASSFEAGKQRTFRVISFSHVLSEAFLQEPTPRDSQLCLRFCWSDVRACMLELERVSSPSVFSVPCRLQPKVLCVFNQGNAVFEVLIQIKGQSSIIMCSVLLIEANIARFYFQLV